MLTNKEWALVRDKFWRLTADPAMFEVGSADAREVFTGETTHFDLQGEFWGERYILIELVADEAPSTMLFLQTSADDITDWGFAAWECDGTWGTIKRSRDAAEESEPMAMTDQPAVDQGTQQKLYQHIQIFGHPGSYIFRPDNDADSEENFRHYNQALLRAIRFLVDSMQNEV
jgi:hypothetical protein